MSIQHIETGPVLDSIIEKCQELEKRCAYYESLYSDLPARYEEAQKKRAEQSGDCD